jgi:hypothetical protein
MGRDEQVESDGRIYGDVAAVAQAGMPGDLRERVSFAKQVQALLRAGGARRAVYRNVESGRCGLRSLALEERVEASTAWDSRVLAIGRAHGLRDL